MRCGYKELCTIDQYETINCEIVWFTTWGSEKPPMFKDMVSESIVWLCPFLVTSDLFNVQISGLILDVIVTKQNVILFIELMVFRNVKPNKRNVILLEITKNLQLTELKNTDIIR